jgi:PAS domain S-box-containing protein
MEVALILFIGGVIIVTWLYNWTRLQQRIRVTGSVDTIAGDLLVEDSTELEAQVAAHDSSDAVLVARGHGQLMYANNPARAMIGMNGGAPNLEQIARIATPSDTFLELFTEERQAAFRLGQRWVEASSHRIPGPGEIRTLVVMREINGGGNGSGDTLDFSKAMAIINQIGNTIDASIGVEQTLQTLLSIISQSIRFDGGEINLRNPQNGELSPRGWLGDSTYQIMLSERGGCYEAGEGLTGWIAQHREALNIPDIQQIGLSPKVQECPYSSFIGVPLLAGINGEVLIGTWELACLEPKAFGRSDFALLQAVSKSAAGAIHNAMLYAGQVRRIEDITMLQNMVDQQVGLQQGGFDPLDQPKSDVSKNGEGNAKSLNGLNGSHREAESENSDNVFTVLSERVANLAEAQIAGVYIYDEQARRLSPMLSFCGLQDVIVRSASIDLPPDSPQRHIFEQQSYWVSNDAQDEELLETLGLQTMIQLGNVQNLVWVPLQAGRRRIGLMMVANRIGGAFTPRDITNVQALAAQIAVIVEKVKLVQREQSIEAQLSAMQEITYAIGALTAESDFYASITSRIAALMDIEMCGILLYDEAKQRLVSRLPFFGVSDDKIQDYSITLEPGTVYDELWNEERYWYSNRVQADTLTYAAGLDQLAAALNVQKTLFAVLESGGRKLGVVQASNKRSGQDFTDADARLLLTFATQAAAVIENARLFQEIQQRSEQAQQLRRLAEAAGKVATDEDAMHDLLGEIAQVMDSKVAFVNMLSQEGMLVTYPSWIYGAEIDEAIFQDTYAQGFENSVVKSRRPFMSNNVLRDVRVIPSYRHWAEKLKITNAILVPLVVGDKVLGELGIGNRDVASGDTHGEVYNEDDLKMIDTISTQISAALDRLLLYRATGQNLTRRMEELDAISRISYELTITLDFDQIVNMIRKEALNATDANGATVALLEPAEKWATPNDPEIQRRLGNARVMTTLADIERRAIARGGGSTIIDDYVLADGLVPSPPEARSALAAAIVYHAQVVGVLHLYHSEPNHFDDQSAAFIQTLAAKASLGYGNAVRFEEQMERSERLRRRVEQLNRIFELGNMLPSSAEPVMVMEAVAYSVQQAVGYDLVLMLMVDEDSGEVERIAQAGLPLEVFENSRSQHIPVTKLEHLLRFDQYQTSESYFFPVEERAVWYDPALQGLTLSWEGKRDISYENDQSWREGDLLLVPIRGTTGRLLGLMSLDAPQSNRRPDRMSIEVLEIFAHQASATLENARLYHASLNSAEQEVRLNEVMETVASTLDVNQIVESVAAGISRLLPATRLTVALIDAEQKGFEVVRVTLEADGSFQSTRDRRISLGRTALGHVYLNRDVLVYRANDAEVPDFEDLKTWIRNGDKVGIVVPLVTGGECLGALHVGSSRAEPSSFLASQSLIRRLAQLVAASVQNARLFNQAYSLQVLNQSVVEAIQQGIVVLNNSGRVVSINEYMRNRYGWDDSVAGQDLFVYRPELVELIGRELRFVLENGIPQERVNQMTLEEDDELLVRNFYMYPMLSNESVRGAVLLVEDVTERAQLEEAMEARANQLAALTAVSTRITATLEREEVITVSLQEMSQLVRYNTMTLWRRTGSWMVLLGAAGTEGIDTSEETRIRITDFDRVRQVVEKRQAVVVNSETPLAELLPGESVVRSWMGVPLVNQSHVIGLIVLTQPTIAAYDSLSDQNIALAFASQVAISITNADLFEQTFDRTNELGTLLEAAQATSVSQDIDQVLATVTQLMLGALEMDQCRIMIWDEVDRTLEVQVDTSPVDTSRVVPSGTLYELDLDSAYMHSLKERDVVVLSQRDQSEKFGREHQALIEEQVTARMLVPLASPDGAIGLIQLDQFSNDGREMTQQKVRLARALSSQIAVAIQNARLTTEMASMFNEALVINDLSRAISTKLNVDDMITIVRDQVPALTGANELYLALYDKQTQTISFPVAVRGGVPYTIPSRSLVNDEVSHIIRTGRQLSLGADYYTPDQLRSSLGIENGEGDAKSYLGIPLKVSNEVFGVLALRDVERTRAFSINDQRILETVGAQLSAAIQNARFFEQVNKLNENLNQLVEERTEELEKERDRLDTLYQITSELARTLDMERLQQRAIGMIAKAVNAEDGVIFGLDPMTDELVTKAYQHPQYVYDDPDGLKEYKLHPAESLASWLIQESSEPSVVIDDLHAFEHWDMSAPGAIQWRSALVVVLESNQNDPQGVMVLLSPKVGAFGEEEMRLVVAAANQVASSINNADLYQLIRDQADRLGFLLRTEQDEAEKNSAILEAIADGVILSDAEGKVILFNNAAERILGLPREQVLGQPLSRFTGLYGNDVNLWAQAIQDHTARAEVEQREEFVDQRLSLGDRIVSAHLSPVFTNERLLGMVSVFRDITRDVEIDRMKAEFISRVSHEFRTPLTSIKGYNDLIMMGALGALNETQQRAMHTIRDNIDRLTILVEDVLDISKVDSGRSTLQIEVVNIQDLVERVIRSVGSKPHHERKNLAVTTQFDPQIEMMEADREKLTRILSNVVDNAFNYTMAGGRITIGTHFEPDANRVIFTVADTGVGIPEHFHDDIWKRFQRYEEHALSLDISGTGLGLSIVKELVEMHGGQITFESEVGRGSTFFISLPVSVPEALRSKTSTGTFRAI